MSSIDDFLLSPALYDDMYRKWEKDPASVDASWRKAFSQFDKAPSPADRGIVPELFPPKYKSPEGNAQGDLLNEKVRRLIHAYRTWGHLEAHFNPLEPPCGDKEELLKLEGFGLSEADLSAFCPTLGLLEKEFAPLYEIVERLKKIYTNQVGYEFMNHLLLEEQNWFISQIEGEEKELSLTEKQMILEQLSKSEIFETFMHTKYVGQKRFSIEGAETLIPMMEEAVQVGADLGIQEFVIGMAHRGRLNVLSNILNKSYADIFYEFDEGYFPEDFSGTGDVKYHKGFESTRKTLKDISVKLTLAPNPSHLESIDGVVEGQVRGKQDRLNGAYSKQNVMPILIHGDAALAGQGVVYETLQMQGLEGYSTGGTLHFVINNQIGFTTTPKEGRSTRYCTDIAKAFGNPVIHVNGEDPEGAIKAVKLAVKYRQKFHRDIFIDLVCWRKYGHNESDEPFFTQPELYSRIKQKKSIRELYNDVLVHSGVLEQVIAESIEKEFKHALSEAKESLALKKSPEAKKGLQSVYTSPQIQTGVPKDQLLAIGKRLATLEEDIKIHPKIDSLRKDRESMMKEDRLIDWGMGEILAYGSILWDGRPVRISGQDVERGTFSHRHAVWLDQTTSKKWIPLNHLREGQGKFSIWNSHLSEFAVLGFDYGYSLSVPQGLTVWEAQFGDFSNGAQVIIDQYLASAEQKWAQKSNLVLFLPHGYEGQGPEHSSGRLERYLSLAAHDNLRIANPTTPRQHFHLLRRQVLDPVAKPLIVFTPKALLRNQNCMSKLDGLTFGTFDEILDDPEPPESPKKIVFCSGKIYYDLKAHIQKIKDFSTVIVRIEQLYPLNEKKLQKIVERYKGVKEFIWAQEEPKNMGAWTFISPLLNKILQKEIIFVGRESSASPAAGIYVFHKKEIHDIMEDVFAKDRPTTYEIAGQIRA